MFLGFLFAIIVFFTWKGGLGIWFKFGFLINFLLVILLYPAVRAALTVIKQGNSEGTLAFLVIMILVLGGLSAIGIFNTLDMIKTRTFGAGDEGDLVYSHHAISEMIVSKADEIYKARIQGDEASESSLTEEFAELFETFHKLQQRMTALGKSSSDSSTAIADSVRAASDRVYSE